MPESISGILSAAWLLLAAAGAAPPLAPDPTLTPGAVATTSAREVCVPGYAAAHRAVTLKTKLEVYDAYRLTPSGRWLTKAATGARYWQSDFEVDHLVSLQLGGSNAKANLWVQSYRTRRYNAWKKDALENRLKALVCAGTLPLVEAQRALATDWRAAYDRYLTASARRAPARPSSPPATR